MVSLEDTQPRGQLERDRAFRSGMIGSSSAAARTEPALLSHLASRDGSDHLARLADPGQALASGAAGVDGGEVLFGVAAMLLEVSRDESLDCNSVVGLCPAVISRPTCRLENWRTGCCSTPIC